MLTQTMSEGGLKRARSLETNWTITGVNRRGSSPHPIVVNIALEVIGLPDFVTRVQPLVPQAE